MNSTATHAEDSVKVPAIPTAGEINKVVTPTSDGHETSASKLFWTGNPAIGVSDKMRFQVQMAKKNASCLEGKKRLDNDVNFYVSGNSESASKISGNFQQGILPGKASDLYIGTSAFKDLMFVTKVTDGSKVLGYNVTLSFCSVQNPYKDKGFANLISDDRQLTNFIAPNGIILSVDSHCDHGTIDAAMNTSITSAVGSSTSGIGTNFQAPTSFAKVGCLSAISDKESSAVVNDSRSSTKPTSIDSPVTEKSSSAVSK